MHRLWEEVGEGEEPAATSSWLLDIHLVPKLRKHAFLFTRTYWFPLSRFPRRFIPTWPRHPTLFLFLPVLLALIRSNCTFLFVLCCAALRLPLSPHLLQWSTFLLSTRFLPLASTMTEKVSETTTSARIWFVSGCRSDPNWHNDDTFEPRSLTMCSWTCNTFVEGKLSVRVCSTQQKQKTTCWSLLPVLASIDDFHFWWRADPVDSRTFQ